MSQAGESLSPDRVERIAQSLEELWDESPEVQETFQEEKWFEFVDAVRTSAASKTTE